MSQPENGSGRLEADDAGEDEPRSRANIIAVVFILALFLAAFWLFKSLQTHREIENCVASGRRDCIQLTPTNGKSS